VLLEGGLALSEPAWDLQDGTGILACEGEDGIDEGVGFDEGSVEIDAERDCRVRFLGEGVEFGWQEIVMGRCGGGAFGLQGGAPDGESSFGRNEMGLIYALKKLTPVLRNSLAPGCVIPESTV